MGILSPVKLILYNLYAKRLLKQIRQGPLPRHVALILDGSRRFTRQHGLCPPSVGHQLGAKKVDELLEWCDELGIPVVTLWALSMDNLRRSPEELRPPVEVIQNKMEDLSQAQHRRFSPRSIHALGRLEALPDSMRRVIADAEARTAQFGPLRLNIALGYDGREEITQGIRRLLLDKAEQEVSLADVANELTSEDISRWLYCENNPDPDLIIRTSGELRLSGFLLWQSVYSELYFCDAPWPAFRKVDFLRALRSYQQRNRRFGK